MKKGVHGGIPKLRRFSLLEYLLGVHMGIPKLERLTLRDLLSSSSITHLKTPFIKSKLKDCKTVKRKTGAEAEKNRTAERKEFFLGTYETQIKKLRTND